MKLFEKLLTLSTILAGLLVLNVSSSPLPSKINKDEIQLSKKGPDDPEVQQLERLKDHLVGSESDVNENQKRLFTSKLHLDDGKTGESVATKRSESDFLSDLKNGINKNSDIHKQLEKMRNLTPEDLAFYIARTADEDGVSLILQEMIAQHVVTADEAMNFLTKVKENLSYLKEETIHERIGQSGNYDIKRTMPMPMETDYDNLASEVPPPTLEDSWEEILYQMSRIIFIQASESGGDLSTEQVLREINLVISKELERGMISQVMQKRLIEVIVSALTETLGTSDDLERNILNPMLDYSIQEPRGQTIPLRNAPIFGKSRQLSFPPASSPLKAKRDTSKA